MVVLPRIQSKVLVQVSIAVLLIAYRSVSAQEDFSSRVAALINSGAFAKAKIALETELKTDPDSVPLLTKLGLVCFRMHEWADAETAYARALVIRPKDPEVLAGLGSALAEQGKLSAALSAFRNSLKLDAKQPSVQFSLARLEFSDGQFKEAIRNFQEAILQDPSNE
jgi:cytochrome c-type biogenesis protein CcmH/NrfG